MPEYIYIYIYNCIHNGFTMHISCYHIFIISAFPNAKNLQMKSNEKLNELVSCYGYVE